MSHTFLYARVSTSDQTAAHQEDQARAAGFKVDEVLADEGVSGVNTLFRDRPAGKRLLDKVRAGDVVVVRWVDRLGRNYADVTDTIREFMRRGVIVRTVINGMTFDGATSDPMQQAVRDALIAFMAATAQAQAEATKEAQKAGVAYSMEHGSRKSRTNGEADHSYLGRKPSYNRAQLEAVRNALSLETGISAIAKETGLSRQTVYRIKDDPAAAEAVLAEWGM